MASNLSVLNATDGTTKVAIATALDANGNTATLHQLGSTSAGGVVQPITAAAPMPITATTLPIPTGAALDATVASLVIKLTQLVTVEQPFQGVVPMTVGTAYTAQRAIRIICTTAGNVSLTYADASVDVIPLAVGVSIYAGAFTAVNSSGTTATATYANLK